jgi:hypothetical protein
MDLQDEEEQGRVDVDPGLSMAELSGFISKYGSTYIIITYQSDG